MTATSRTSKIVSDSQGEQVHHLYGGPVFYKDKSGNYKDIDMSHVDASSTIGNITLREKHSSSIGIRKDNSKTKYLGIRPDETQEDGTNQMEWSIVNVEFDGVSQDIDLSKNDVSGNKVDLGDVIIHNTKVYTRQLVKYNGTATDFKIEFDLHLQNMSILNDKYDTSYEFRKPCSLDIVDIGENNGQYIWEYHILNPLTVTDAKKINVIIGKITDNHIMTSSLNKSEEFSDTSLSGYNTTDMANINSSMYMKDTICMCFQNQNLSLEFYEFIKDKLCKLWNCTFTEYAYFTDSNGKKFGSCIEDSVGRVFVFINTKEVPDNIKSLFLRKDFSDTGYIDVTIDSMKTSLKSIFNYTHSSVPVDTSYYKPSENGIFTIDNGIGQKYRIPYPVILDNDFINTDISTYHTLKDNGNGTYRYTKYLTQESIMQELLLNCGYIDSTTNINASTDASVFKLASSGLLNVSWNSIDSQQTAGSSTIDSVNLYGDSSNEGAYVNWKRTVGYGGTTYRHYVAHCIFWFDTSSISATVTDSKLYINGGWFANLGTDQTLTVMKGRDQGGDSAITSAEFHAVDGHSSGALNSSGHTGYSSLFTWESIWPKADHSPIFSDLTNSSIDLNSNANNDIKNDNTLYALLAHWCTWYDSPTGGGAEQLVGGVTHSNWIFFEGYNYDGDHTGTASNFHQCSSGEHPPYLAVTTGTPAATPHNSIFFGANF